MHQAITAFRSCAFFLLLASCGIAQYTAQSQIPPSYGQPPTPRVVAYVQLSLQHGDLASAAALVGQYRRLNGDTPEALDALSWLARGELAAGDSTKAWQEAEEIIHSSQAALGTRKLDAEPYLPLALGSAYETEAEILVSQQKRSEALQLLESAQHTWRGTSIVERLQKNINLLTLQGKPMPPLHATEWIGPKPKPVATYRGKPILIFFWSHWCSDCKVEEPIIADLAREFEPRGLVVVAPTELYGYTATNDHASLAEETAFIKKVFDKYYSGIPDAQIPLDTGNFERFGVSTTPTMVVVDRRGIVRLYHPGLIEEESLRRIIEPLLPPPITARAAR